MIRISRNLTALEKSATNFQTTTQKTLPNVSIKKEQIQLHLS